jgi:hypothetical protein
MAERTFLLSPTSAAGERMRLLLSPHAAFDLARRPREGAATLGKAFEVASSLYFRGKRAYARAFARPPAGVPGVLVIAPGRGFCPRRSRSPSSAASPGCPGARPTVNDATGRLRGLWVSSVGAAGDLLKLMYTWQADQIVATDTCLLGTATPRTETFSYDATLRLTGAGRPAGNFAATGGAFSSRSYSYDGRSNRTSGSADGIAVRASYAASQVDRQTDFSAGSHN